MDRSVVWGIDVLSEMRHMPSLVSRVKRDRSLFCGCVSLSLEYSHVDWHEVPLYRGCNHWDVSQRCHYDTFFSPIRAVDGLCARGFLRWAIQLRVDRTLAIDGDWDGRQWDEGSWGESCGNLSSPTSRSAQGCRLLDWRVDVYHLSERLVGQSLAQWSLSSKTLSSFRWHSALYARVWVRFFLRHSIIYHRHKINWSAVSVHTHESLPQLSVDCLFFALLRCSLVSGVLAV